MKCRDCVCYKEEWCSIMSDSPDPDMERDCGHFIRAQRWIPVTERMPEDDIPQGRKMVTVFVCSEARRVQIASRVYWPEKDEWRWSKMMNNYVTHWMSLPEPPEVSE